MSCCKAADVLHEANLVHRDLRMPNIVMLSEGNYMIIDLESCASIDKKLPRSFSTILRTCTLSALDNDKFTATSDMFCIAQLLEDAGQHLIHQSPAARHFIGRLKGKELAAHAALEILQQTSWT